MGTLAKDRAQKYRERLKEKGGKVFRMTFSPEHVKAFEILGDLVYPDTDMDGMLREMVAEYCHRMLEVMKQQLRLENEFNCDPQTVKAYATNEHERLHPLTAEEFLQATGQT